MSCIVEPWKSLGNRDVNSDKCNEKPAMVHVHSTPSSKSVEMSHPSRRYAQRHAALYPKPSDFRLIHHSKRLGFRLAQKLFTGTVIYSMINLLLIKQRGFSREL